MISFQILLLLDTFSSRINQYFLGSHPALPAEPGTLKATLPDTPQISQITESESAHPVSQVESVALTNGMGAVTLNTPTKTAVTIGKDNEKVILINDYRIRNKMYYIRYLAFLDKSYCK